jgi:hypothetical protein
MLDPELAQRCAWVDINIMLAGMLAPMTEGLEEMIAGREDELADLQGFDGQHQPLAQDIHAAAKDAIERVDREEHCTQENIRSSVEQLCTHGNAEDAALLIRLVEACAAATGVALDREQTAENHATVTLQVLMGSDLPGAIMSAVQVIAAPAALEGAPAGMRSMMEASANEGRQALQAAVLELD